LRLKVLEELNRKVRKDAAKFAKSEFGYPGQGLRRLSCPVSGVAEIKTKRTGDLLTDNESGRRSKLRLYKKELKILEN